GEDGRDEPTAEAPAAPVRQDINVAQPGEAGEVADHPAEADLYALLVVKSEAERGGERAFEDRARDARRPIALLAEIAENGVAVEPGGIGADGEAVAPDLEGWGRHAVSHANTSGGREPGARPAGSSRCRSR